MSQYLQAPRASSRDNANSACLYCGALPLDSHAAAWVNESLAIALGPVDRTLTSHPLLRPIFRTAQWLVDFFTKIFLKVGRALGFASYHEDVSRVGSMRAKALWEDAARRGIAMKSWMLFGKELDYYEAAVSGASRSPRTIFFSGLPRPPAAASKNLSWMDDKLLMKRRLEAAGVPVPRGEAFSKFGPLREYFDSLAKPAIIKPRVGSRGRHTLTFINNEDELRRAFDIAKQICHWVVLEEHLTGSVYRGTVIDGVLRGVLAGDPPRVAGDGASTIAQLIEMKNRTKMADVKDVIVTRATEEFLMRIGYSLGAVLPRGTTIDLSEKIGVNYGGASREVSDAAHPSFAPPLESAGRAVGDPLLGFDFIAEDITRPAESQRWGIIECNSLPFINLHHYPLIGPPRNVAKYVWDQVTEA